jgi:hypothetical protein
VPADSVASLFAIDPGYKSLGEIDPALKDFGPAEVRVVGAYALEERKGVRLVEA